MENACRETQGKIAEMEKHHHGKAFFQAQSDA